jgi:hypothetical protein
MIYPLCWNPHSTPLPYLQQNRSTTRVLSPTDLAKLREKRCDRSAHPQSPAREPIKCRTQTWWVEGTPSKERSARKSRRGDRNFFCPSNWFAPIPRARKWTSRANLQPSCRDANQQTPRRLNQHTRIKRVFAKYQMHKQRWNVRAASCTSDGGDGVPPQSYAVVCIILCMEKQRDFPGDREPARTRDSGCFRGLTGCWAFQTSNSAWPVVARSVLGGLHHEYRLEKIAA